MKLNQSPESKLDAALDREIEALFTVEPSPEFLQRVRAHIAQAPGRRAWRLRWILPGSAALAAAFVCVLLLFWSHETIRIEPPTLEVSAAAPAVQSVTMDHPSTIASNPIPKPMVRQQRVIVAPNEAAALRRLLQGPLVQFPAGVPEAPAAQLHISEIEIKPLAAPTPIVIAPVELSAPASE